MDKKQMEQMLLMLGQVLESDRSLKTLAGDRGVRSTIDLLLTIADKPSPSAFRQGASALLLIWGKISLLAVEQQLDLPADQEQLHDLIDTSAVTDEWNKQQVQEIKFTLAQQLVFSLALTCLADAC